MFYKKVLLASVAAAIVTSSTFAQKKPLDHNVYDMWEHVSSPRLSPDGKIIIYSIEPQQGDSRLFVQNLETDKKVEIGRGALVSVSKDWQWCILNIKAPYEDTRKARIAKKKSEEMPKDTLAVMNLSDFSTLKLEHAGKPQIPQDGKVRIAYEGEVTKPEKVKVFVLLDPETGKADTLRNVDRYSFDRTGEKIAVVFKKDKKDSLSMNKVSIYDFPDFKETVLDTGKVFYSNPVFDYDGDKAVFIASTEDNKSGNKHCSVFLTEKITEGKGKKAVTSLKTREIVPQDYSDGKLCVTENASPVFSLNGKRIFLGIAECAPQKDTTIIDFESAQLDIWNWDIYMTPPMQKVNADRLAKAACKSVIDLDGPERIVPLTRDKLERITVVGGGNTDWAVATDDKSYQISSTWDSNDLSDVYFVNLKDGQRRCFKKGLDGSLVISPEGKYLVWYDNADHDWHSYCVADGRTANLTENLDGIFYDDEDDHPMPEPFIDRPHWIEGDESFLMADKFDIWLIRADGSKAECLTKGEGRASGTRYRITFMTPYDISKQESDMGISRVIGKKDVVDLIAFNRTTKENGFAHIKANSSGILDTFTAPATYSGFTRAKDTGAVAYLKGDVKNPNDLYVSGDLFKTEKKLTGINPQQEEYNWCDVRLVHWNAYDGTALDGLLYTPEDLDTTRSYPMVIYFYEKYSENLFKYIQPAPSRSTVNLSFYASRGYVVFVPDIVYKDGHPGESAYNCICSGAEAMCKQFPFIDRNRMGIQGQSWGGYQTAYLVTRTNMFAAAGAGAPVGNMTSAYGGIRWESGHVRAMQYEHGQSRIGKSLWDEGGLDLYIENSPIFHTQDVTTPVLIMHNDNDGAVPWYQGIEFFMALRRFKHPAWLLQYNGEAHNLAQRRNAKDLSVRLQQFFDHYLKGEPMPAWMKDGVPYNRKGQYYGLELTGE